MYRTYGKRTLDFCFASGALVALLPVALVVALLVRIKLGAPVFFRQERPGLNEKIFVLYKFRTMSDAVATRPGETEAHRVGAFGRLLRVTSLDEIPGLYNVVRGDMSLVGPRPLLKEYLPYYTEEERLRHKVRPGFTGLAQISGRNDLRWEQRFAKDIEYVETYSLGMDILIILKTIAKVLRMEGALPVPGVNLKRLDVERRNNSVPGAGECQ